MKQIDNMQKKAYAEPMIKVVEIDQTDLICESPETPQPHNYDDELDVKEYVMGKNGAWGDLW